MSQPLSKLRWCTLAICLALLAGSGVAHADEKDHERARKALQAGEVLPLKTILERVERAYPGQVMDVELERDHRGSGGRWIYEIKVLHTSGALVKLKVDARDGTVLGSKSRDHTESERPTPTRSHSLSEEH
ncbi:MAG: PepSY domain-containing protein [Rhodoferax sp.]|nr:PepSY domain-containing protein [Rhodoferax sp.]